MMIPDGIVRRRSEYIAALRGADAAWTTEVIDLHLMEDMLEKLMADQLLSALEEAKGKPMVKKNEPS
jgi:hypothetical protein